jgi:hypothetical protein
MEKLLMKGAKRNQFFIMHGRNQQPNEGMRATYDLWKQFSCINYANMLFASVLCLVKSKTLQEKIIYTRLRFTHSKLNTN